MDLVVMKMGKMVIVEGEREKLCTWERKEKNRKISTFLISNEDKFRIKALSFFSPLQTDCQWRQEPNIVD